MDLHRTWTPSVLQTQPEVIKQIWCQRRFRTAPILSTWTVSHWPNSHGSIPWWTKEANLRHPMSKCHVSVWGCKQTPMHILLPAQGAWYRPPCCLCPWPGWVPHLLAKFRWTLSCCQMMHVWFPIWISISETPVIQMNPCTAGKIHLLPQTWYYFFPTTGGAHSPNQDRDKKTQVYKVSRPRFCCPSTQERWLLLVKRNEMLGRVLVYAALFSLSSSAPSGPGDEQI